MDNVYTDFDNEWLCPYCAALTDPADRTCPNCRRSLIVRKRLREDRTVWLWRGIFLQLMTAIYLVIFTASAFTLLVKLSDITDPIPFLPLYFGLPVDQPQSLIQTVLTAFPPWAFWGLIGAILYSLALMILLYIRIPYGHLLYLISAGALLSLGATGLVLYHDSRVILGTSIVGLLLGGGQLFITLKLWYDFTFKEHRLPMKIDAGVKTHTGFFISARQYGQAGMWGLAVIHLRRAVVRRPRNLSYRMAMAVAYINIKRYDLAEQELQETERLAPDKPEVRRLRKQLASRVKG